MKRAALLLLLGVLAASPAWAQVAVGSPAPEFSLKDTQGMAHRLSDFKGKVVVLEWSNPDCPFVKKFYGLGSMQALQGDYTARGVVWLSINSSAPGKEGYYPPAELDARLAAMKFAGTAALVDPDGTVGRLYGAQTTPHMFVIDPAGVLVYQGAIDSNSSPDPAAIPSSTNYVVMALEAVIAGKPVELSATKSYGCSVKY